MAQETALVVADVRIDLANESVWRGEQAVKLTPTAFALLRYLVEHAGQLVTKEELLQALWPETAVTEGVLTTHVGQLRQALGDEAKAPRFIETVHRRGYRFIGKVASSQYSVASRRETERGSQLTTDHWQLTTLLVGREAELQQLHDWLAKALAGERQLVFVTGEAGLGKTTVVEAFLQRLETRDWRLVPSSQVPSLKPQVSSLWLGRGQCIEHHGPGEAYLPVLEALGRLCREPEGQRLVDLLSQHAPTWLVQMPALLRTTDLEALQRRTHGATRERMLRELAEAIEVLTTERPLVLWLEDLQWSDVSTLDWLALTARRQEAARFLVIGTYRPVEVIVSNHALKSIKQELQVHGQCVELPLSFLTEEHVTQYLVRRFVFPPPASAGEACPEQGRRGQGEGLASATLRKLTHLIHRRTEGNPLFLVNLVDYLIARGVLARSDGQGTLPGEVTAAESGVPESLQQMIEKQIERLSGAEKKMLEVASVAGGEFSATAVAAGVGAEIDAVEEQCAGLVQREQFVRAKEVEAWPDGTIATRYEFLHALYRSVLYEGITARRRQRLHRQIGERQEQAYRERTRGIAAELAVHFERGRNYGKAVQYLRQAGENASRRSAYVEALRHLTTGLGLLEALPNTPERAQQELTLQLALGIPLMATKGYAAPEVEQAYSRARELCQHLGAAPQLFSALMGLSSVYLIGARLQTAREVGEQCLRLAQSTHNATRLMGVHTLLGQILFYLGEFALAHDHVAQGIALYDPQKHNPFVSRAVQDSKVSCLSFAARSLWMLGYPDQALKSIQEALTLAQELAHPFSLAYTLYNATILHHFRRERHAAQERIAALLAIAREQGFPQYIAQGTIWRGWALAEQGEGEKGVAQIRQGLAAYRATGSGLGPPHYLALLAEVYGTAEQAEEGLMVLAEALATVNKTGERFYEAELYRLYGELSLRIGEAETVAEESEKRGRGETEISTRESVSSSPVPRFSGSPVLSSSARFPVSSPEESFQKAIEIARKQQAKSLELRATVSLTRLWQQQGKKKQAPKMLAEIYGWFTEGFDTKDLQEAKALLLDLER